MIAYGWTVAALSGVLALLPWFHRPTFRDRWLFAGGAIGVAVWNVCASYYLVGPLPYRISALYLTGVAVAVTAWLMVARRVTFRSWWPRRPMQLFLAAPPVLLAGSALLPEHVWERLFWTTTPWRNEQYGVCYEIHSVGMMLLIAIGAAAAIRRAENTTGLDRWLASAAAASVLVGVGAQLADVRIMGTCAFAAMVFMTGTFLRINPNSVEAMATMAERDPVTDTMSRSGLNTVLRHAVRDARTQGTPLSVMVIDLDDFKSINDDHGHLTGDEVLNQVAGRLKSVVGDSVGRFGGDEFVVILPGLDSLEAEELAAEVVSNATGPLAVTNSQVAVRLSVGVAEYDGDGEVEDLLISADRAMYSAKRRGGGLASIPQPRRG
ncbi:GGDEF domain-containing protein [Nocardioides sp.]|uniref:GGDEF domain-containing protein n=1 Tax=Nocardioides sp. TaxID=35761 RepID=UPI00261AFA1A|nr:GGDEF domain-containing protein [Nocardioides sp.]